VEWLGQVVVGTEAQTAYLVLDAGQAGQDQDRRLDLGNPERAQNLIARHVGEVQIEQDDVVIVELTEIDTLFAEIGCVNVEAFGLQHQLDALRGSAVVLDQKHAHKIIPSTASVEAGNPHLRFTLPANG
jgi:hypothetical protein